MRIEDILQEKYPNLPLLQIEDLKIRLVRFYTCCAKITLNHIQERPYPIPENSSDFD